jgi:hypothetical protein
MAIAADSSLPTGPPSATDWVAASVAAASKTSTATAVIASSAVAVAIANDNNNPCDGHGANNRIQIMMTDDRTDDAEEKEHGMPSSKGIETFTLMGGNSDDVWGYKGDVVTARTVIPPTAKSLLRAYFVSVNWPLNKVLPKEGSCCPVTWGLP